MWTQLAMAGLNAYQNEQNRMNDIANNAITSKYSAWTGQNPNWSSQGKQSGMKTMTQGLMAGLLQNQEDERARKDEELRNKLLESLKPQASNSPRINRAPAVEPVVASGPVSVASPVSPQVPAQGPIAPMSNISFPVVGAPQIPFAPTSEEDLLKAQNPWLAMAQNYVAPVSQSANRMPAVEAPVANTNGWSRAPKSNTNNGMRWGNSGSTVAYNPKSAGEWGQLLKNSIFLDQPRRYIGE